MAKVNGVTIPGLIHLGHEVCSIVIKVPEEHCITTLNIMADTYGMDCVEMLSSDESETHKLMVFEIPDPEEGSIYGVRG